MSSLEMRKFVAPEFVFGTEAINLTGQYAQHYYSKKVLVVTDKGVIDAGWLDRVTESLDAVNIPYSVFSELTPNPKDYEVFAGVECYLKHHCDVIIAVGGGSPMDCAKAIAIVSTNHSPIHEFEGIDKVRWPMPPLICVPTTGGTSADVSQFAIITNSDQKRKMAIISKSVVPDIALVDPLTLLTMDPYLSACSGMDALVHAIEAFVSNANSAFTDLHALESIRILNENLEQSIIFPDNVDYRIEVMRGSLEAGLAFSNASLGGVHAMAHALGGTFDLPHGECNSLLLEHMIRFNYKASEDRYKKIAQVMKMNLRNEPAQQVRNGLIEKLRALRTRIGICDALGSRGIHASDISSLARKAIADPCMVTNPRIPVLRDIEVVYEEAL